MSDETQDLGTSSKSLDDVLAECIAAEESGRALDREALCRQHPQHAAELREFLANRDKMQRLAEPLQGETASHRNGHPLGKVRYFGDYELLDEIAAGGMGIVYKARQVSLNRVVAVKMILKGTLAGEDDVKRFRAEAEAAANLQHPGIVAIHEVGLHEGQHYFSMDYVEGQSLAHFPRENPLSANQAAEYVQGAAEAVHYAHQQGTLHRDLKPSNILIDRQGRVRITDFGLAKRIQGNSDLTLTGQILGTPSYMPPEQALGKRSLIGTASDVYSLGAVLYELLTGRPPFRGESPGETLRQVETLDPVSPRLLNPATPRDLETICLKCLDKEPHKRYLNAQHLADDLGRFRRGEPIIARPISRPARAWRWCRRNPVVASLGGTVLLLLTVVIPALLIYHNLKITDELDRTRQAEHKEKNAKLDEKAAKRVALERLATSYLHLARATRLSRAVGQRHASLSAVDDALNVVGQLDLPKSEHVKRLADLRTETIAALALPDLRLIRESSVPEAGWPAAVDPQLEHFAWRSFREGELSFWRIADGALITRFNGFHAVFSPDGKFVASDDAQWKVLSRRRLGDANPLWSVPRDPYGLEVVWAFSPDGLVLAVPNAKGAVDFYDADTGALNRQIKTPGAPSQIEFDPAGKRLAVLCGREAYLIELEGGTAIREPRRFPRPKDNSSASSIAQSIGYIEVVAIQWSPDGTRLAILGHDGRIKLYDVGTEQLVATMAGDSRGGVQLAFDPTGQVLASVGWNSDLRLWSTSTGELLLRTRDDSAQLRFHSERPWLGPIRRESKMGIWELELPDVFRTLGHASSIATPPYYSQPAMSSDQRLLAVQVSGGVAIWDRNTGRDLGFLPVAAAVPAFEQSTALLTLNGQSLLRWPLAKDPESPAGLRLGPPEKLLAIGAHMYSPWVSRDGSAVVIFYADEVHVRRGKNFDEHLTLPHVGAWRADVSADGKWIVTASHIDGTVKVWDAVTGKLAHDFDTPNRKTDVAFSPDCRWLTTAGNGHRLWRVGDWTPAGELGPSKEHCAAGAFAEWPGNGRVVAIAHADATIRLIDPQSGREQAQLINPSQTQADYLSLSPDGSSLIACDNDSHSVQVWDLRRLRATLGDRGLDWEAPPLQPPMQGSPVTQLRIVGDASTVDRQWAESEIPRLTTRLANHADDAAAAFRRGQAYLHMGQVNLALRDLAFAIEHGHDSFALSLYEPWLHKEWLRWRNEHDGLFRVTRNQRDQRRIGMCAWDAYELQEFTRAAELAAEALAIDSADPTANSILARIKLFGPPRLRDLDRGLEHARRAYDANPGRMHATTLAAAYIHLDRLAEAKPLLSEEVKYLENVHDLFLLSLIHQREGDSVKAREFYVRARQQRNRWVKSFAFAELSELNRLRDEVEHAVPPTNPDVPDFVSPNEGATLDNGRRDRQDRRVWQFSWRTVAGATLYELEIQAPTPDAAPWRRKLAEPEYSFSDLKYVTTQKRLGWKWRVRAFRGEAALPWSETRAFDIEPPDTDAAVQAGTD